MSIVAVHGPHTWGQQFFAESDHIIVNLLGPEDLEFKSKVTEVMASGTSYEWDFGDGTRLMNGFEMTHTYAHPGVFIVTMTAHTKNGPVTDQIEIELNGEGPQTLAAQEEPEETITRRAA